MITGGGKRSSHVLIRRDAFQTLARGLELEPVWTVIGERLAITDDETRRPDIRVRYNGLSWLEGDAPRTRHWSRDD